MKPYMKQELKQELKQQMQPYLKPLACSTLLLGVMFSLLGCQQTQITFTPTAEPQLPVFDKLQGAPEITSLNYQELPYSEPVSVTPKLDLYLFDDTLSGLNHLSLVAYSNLPMANLDVLVQAFKEKRAWLVQQSTLACAESLSIRPSMHSLTISIDCPDSPSLATKLLMQFWQAASINQTGSFDEVGSFDEIDIANVRRQLKLAKHINAYSGAEIDNVWAKKILGEQHVYNQSLNDKTLADKLNLAKLNRVRDTILAQANWAFFANNSLELGANNSLEKEFSAALAKQFEVIAFQQDAFKNALPAQDAAPSKNAASDTASLAQAKPLVSLSNSNKTLYLIDAPGSVQTQVRIGYPLDASNRHLSSTQDCKLLASWLGRSFSGRLYYDLREVRGLTYGIYGRCFDNPLSRTLKFYGSTKLEHSGAFISGVLDHLALATQTPASAAEVSALKNYLTSQQMLRQANFRAVEFDSIKQLVRGYTPERQQQEAARLANLTPAQLQQIAASVFNNAPYIVIRGDAAKISDDIKKKLPEWNIVEASVD
ncbi:peptidase M16 domain protein [Shewanella halifaxensis HAW-EB4]|uniref:Peptidase M16 domain protein n=1 Tax=Shewanella halifaxensis (strain HAW-EB4) TaxID=458817 RepID=B0TTF8_SHEHH|nr:insulinase family protein [Shewanella halifaxensis]ABZ78099.1 peptidase M16 domain protein [Shewanella halifaxensis HAW-EB4]